jgi:hypothetical protein
MLRKNSFRREAGVSTPHKANRITRASAPANKFRKTNAHKLRKNSFCRILLRRIKRNLRVLRSHADMIGGTFGVAVSEPVQKIHAVLFDL